MSVKTEIPGVNNAVQRLQELADRMRTDDFGFRNNDVNNIDGVIDALHQLEAERKVVHDLLETETIKASVLRHSLRQLPRSIRDEVMHAVMAARTSNAQRLLELQDDLARMNANIITLDKRSRELEAENAVLHPERELLKQQHEEIISQLNQRMAEKAQLQIALNETRDEVRQANQDIVDMEDGILQLKEDLIQERTEARQEKKRLKRAVTDTTQKTKEQKDQNVHKKKELDGVQEKLTSSECQLDSVRKNIRRYETSRAKLEGEERALAAQLSKQLKMNDQMRIKGAQIMNERIQETRSFEEKQKDFEEKIKQYKEEIQMESGRHITLEKQKKDLLADLADKEEIKEEDAERVKDADAQLQSAKEALNSKAEEVGAMQMENIDMQEQIEALGESHKAVLAQLNKQIEEYKDELSRERKERLELQGQKDNVSKNLDDLKSEAAQFMSEMTNLVQGSKKRHTELSNEGIQLQRNLKEHEQTIGGLSEEVKTAQSSYSTAFADYQYKVSVMQEEVLNLERALEDKTVELEERTPVFHNLEKYFEERTTQYDEKKKEIVAMKNKKQGLEDEIRRTQRDKEVTLAPQAGMREDLKAKRAALMHQMKTNGVSTQEKEQDIFQMACKLRAIIEENQRFEDSCHKVEEDLADIQDQMEQNKKRIASLQADLVKQKGELMKKWETDSMMQEFFASRDEATAEAFARLLDRTEKRENKIDMITERLSEELFVLSGFLDNITARRPPGRRRSKADRRKDVRRRSRQSSRSRSRSQSRGRERSQSNEHRSSDRSQQSSRHTSKSPQREASTHSKERSHVSFADRPQSEVGDD